jgi:quercetin dioxygenase-like cupin family protein
MSLIPVKKEQLVNFVEKVWGHEEWIINTEKYCGKKLFFKEGYRLSMHYHKIKDETFYVVSGRVLMETEYEGKNETKVMTPGDVQRILPNMLHRVTALQDSDVIEFSTHHMDDDSYRITPSCKIDLSTLQL